MAHEFVSAETLLATTWTLFTLAVFFVAARYAIRIKVFGELMIDDAFLLFALFTLLVGDVLSTVNISNIYIIEHTVFYHSRPPPHFTETTTAFAKLQYANVYMWFTTLWLVKGCFLIYIRDMTEGLHRHRQAWWCVVLLTILTYLGCIILYPILNHNFATQTETMKYKAANIRYQFSADLATDILILLLPLTLACKAKIPLKRKLSLAGIFSLEMIVSIFSIVRYVVCAPDKSMDGPGSVILWSTIEESVAIVVACFLSFRTLVVSRQQQHHNTQNSLRSYSNFPSNALSDHKRRNSVVRTKHDHATSEDSVAIQLLDDAPANIQSTQGSNYPRYKEPEYGIAEMIAMGSRYTNSHNNVSK